MENLKQNTLCFKIPVDPSGDINPSFDRLMLNFKNQDNYNHKRLWENRT